MAQDYCFGRKAAVWSGNTSGNGRVRTQSHEGEVKAVEPAA